MPTFRAAPVLPMKQRVLGPTKRGGAGRSDGEGQPAADGERGSRRPCRWGPSRGPGGARSGYGADGTGTRAPRGRILTRSIVPGQAQDHVFGPYRVIGGRLVRL